MPTAKPRITLTLEPHVYEVLRRLSLASGEPMSSIVTDFLDVAIPQLERVVVVLERAKTMPEEAKEGVRASLRRAEANLLPTLMGALNQNDLFLTEVAEAMRGAEDKPAEPARPRARKSLTTPVPVTRGSGHRKPSTKGRGGAGV